LAYLLFVYYTIDDRELLLDQEKQYRVKVQQTVQVPLEYRYAKAELDVDALSTTGKKIRFINSRILLQFYNAGFISKVYPCGTFQVIANNHLIYIDSDNYFVK